MRGHAGHGGGTVHDSTVGHAVPVLRLATVLRRGLGLGALGGAVRGVVYLAGIGLWSSNLGIIEAFISAARRGSAGRRRACSTVANSAGSGRTESLGLHPPRVVPQGDEQVCDRLDKAG